MKKTFHLIAFFSLLILSCSFTSQKKPIVNQGEVTYFFENGTMQCLSEMDAQGQIIVFLKSLDKNTTLKFVNLTKTRKGDFLLKAMMFVKKDTDLCASWVNAQELNIEIDPKSVETTNLQGDIVYNQGRTTVIIDPKSKSLY